jgi:hypothetical protein
LAARGLFFEVLFIANESERPGYLVADGVGMDLRVIAERVLADEEDVELLLDELLAAGALVRQSDGGLSCPCILAALEVSRQRSAAGKAGGNPILNASSKLRQAETTIPPPLDSVIQKSQEDNQASPHVDNQTGPSKLSEEELVKQEDFTIAYFEAQAGRAPVKVMKARKLVRIRFLEGASLEAVMVVIDRGVMEAKAAGIEPDACRFLMGPNFRRLADVMPGEPPR